jgi:hypothetical protein
MSAIPSLLPPVLQKLCDVLGDTSTGLILQPEFVILLVRAARGRLSRPADRQGGHR